MSTGIGKVVRDIIQAVPRSLNDSICHELFLSYRQAFQKARAAISSKEATELVAQSNDPRGEITVLVGTEQKSFRCQQAWLESRSGAIKRSLQVQDPSQPLLLKHIDASGFGLLLQALQGKLVVDEKNMIALFRVADELEVPSIRDTASRLFQQSDLEIYLCNDKFPSLPRGLVMTVLMRNDLSCTEMELFRLVVGWGQQELKTQGKETNKDNLRVCVGELLSLLRFPLMSSDQLLGEVQQSGLLKEEVLLQIVISQNSNEASGFLKHPRLNALYTAVEKHQRKLKLCVEVFLGAFLFWHVCRNLPFFLPLLPLLSPALWCLFFLSCTLTPAVVVVIYTIHATPINVFKQSIRNFLSNQATSFAFKEKVVVMLVFANLVAAQMPFLWFGLHGWVFYHLCLPVCWAVCLLLTTFVCINTTQYYQTHHHRQLNLRMIFCFSLPLSLFLLPWHLSYVLSLLLQILWVVVKPFVLLMLRVMAIMLVCERAKRVWVTWKTTISFFRSKVNFLYQLKLLIQGCAAFAFFEFALWLARVPVILWNPLMWTLKYVLRLVQLPIIVFTVVLMVFGLINRKFNRQPEQILNIHFAWLACLMVEIVFDYFQLQTPFIEPFWDVVLLSIGLSILSAFLAYSLSITNPPLPSSSSVSSSSASSSSSSSSSSSFSASYFPDYTPPPLWMAREFLNWSHVLKGVWLFVMFLGQCVWKVVMLKPVFFVWELLVNAMYRVLALGLYPPLFLLHSMLAFYPTSSYSSLSSSLASASSSFLSSPLISSLLSFFLSFVLLLCLRVFQSLLFRAYLVWKRQINIGRKNRRRMMMVLSGGSLLYLALVELSLCYIEHPAYPPFLLPTFSRFRFFLVFVFRFILIVLRLFGDVIRAGMMVGLLSLVVVWMAPIFEPRVNLSFLLQVAPPPPLRPFLSSLLLSLSRFLSLHLKLPSSLPPLLPPLLHLLPLSLSPELLLSLVFLTVCGGGGVVMMETLVYVGWYPVLLLPDAFVMPWFIVSHMAVAGVVAFVCHRFYQALQVPAPNRRFFHLKASSAQIRKWLWLLSVTFCAAFVLLGTHFLSLLYYVSLSFLHLKWPLRLVTWLVEMMIAV